MVNPDGSGFVYTNPHLTQTNGAVSFKGVELMFDDSIPEDNVYMVNPSIARSWEKIYKAHFPGGGDRKEGEG